MVSLIILAMTIVSCTSASPSKDREIVPAASSSLSSNDVDFMIENYRKFSRKTSSEREDVAKNEETETKDDEEILLPIAMTNDQRDGLTVKKGRKHKAYFINYPFVPQISRNNNQLTTNYEKGLKNYENNEGRKKLSNRKRYQQESQIYYIKLPPTPYTYVPGFGYISQPPTYSTPGHQRPPINYPQRPIRPIVNHQKPTNNNPFIKVPVDFVSNGKPTGVYQWPAKRRETNVNRLTDGPYVFNGRPTSLYLLNSDGKKIGHQPIRLADNSNDVYY